MLRDILAKVKWGKVVALIVIVGVCVLCASHYALRGRTGGDLFIVGLPSSIASSLSSLGNLARMRSDDDDDDDDYGPTPTVMVTKTEFATLTVETWATITLPIRYTTRGCKCAQSWTFNGKDCDKMCCNFDNDPKGEWCAVEDPSKCIVKGRPREWGYCAKPGDP
eukprot:TRINITY_DN585_c1_g1_i1.p1 TRINITY_DN585_c1_g1~~TRINITY_DN585_c1_g1_i1.p1  ORF type:complete len:165 (+),score=20.85 TRINITY_DN585_c1_g1_i1:252-746(+)